MSAGSTSRAWELRNTFVKRREGGYKEQAEHRRDSQTHKYSSTLARARGKGSFVIRSDIMKEPRSEMVVTLTDIFWVIAKFYI